MATNTSLEGCSDSFFTVLDAPQLRDDFYCSLLAYSHRSRCLAVGLKDTVFLWSENRGVRPMRPGYLGSAHVTAVSFSSTEGGKEILATGRADGYLSLWAVSDSEARFDIFHASPVASVAWRPRACKRVGQRDSAMGRTATAEDLLLGDEDGRIFYYRVQWPDADEQRRGTFSGAVALLFRMPVHTLQVCGLAWSPDGELYASGGNDNACCLFEADTVIRASRSGRRGSLNDSIVPAEDIAVGNGIRRQLIFPLPSHSPVMAGVRPKHRWVHGAAVKAIAFCPWQKGLIATGGGSNDRAIHFFHTGSGAPLALIDVAAQVTSLVWSTTRREIAATFGYAQPEHPFRVAVYSWPECQQLVAIPWAGDIRALHAIPYPGGPDSSSRAGGGGGGGSGLLGGSDILESLAGFEKPGAQTIR